jgi:hypothetical protein
MTMVEAEEVKAKVERLDWRTFMSASPETPESTTKALDDYFSKFVAVLQLRRDPHRLLGSVRSRRVRMGHRARIRPLRRLQVALRRTPLHQGRGRRGRADPAQFHPAGSSGLRRAPVALLTDQRIPPRR